jgi:hypothetical protein
MVTIACSECRAWLGLLPPNMMTVPDTMISGPPMRPSHVALRGTRPERYIR